MCTNCTASPNLLCFHSIICHYVSAVRPTATATQLHTLPTPHTFNYFQDQAETVNAQLVGFVCHSLLTVANNTHLRFEAF